jgi:hypothetical protein
MGIGGRRGVKIELGLGLIVGLGLTQHDPSRPSYLVLRVGRTVKDAGERYVYIPVFTPDWQGLSGPSDLSIATSASALALLSFVFSEVYV